MPVTRRQSLQSAQESNEDENGERFPRMVTPRDLQKAHPFMNGSAARNGRVANGGVRMGSGESFARRVACGVWRCVFDPASLWLTGSLLLLVEAVVCVLIINRVKYTEIDWTTYMQHVELVLNGTRDYSKISGDTGPCPYPAGYLYIYGLLYKLTDAGVNIVRAQYIFAGLYLTTIALVLAIYNKVANISPYVAVVSSVVAYRVHSIYVLRLFNDPVAQTLLYAAVLALLHRRYAFAALLYSVAVSVKMNILLFAPGLFVVLVVQRGYLKTFAYITLCALVQLAFALPFMTTSAHAWAYVSRSFNVGRVFLYEWTVNWRVLPEHVFVDRRLHAALLAAHLVVLLAFAFACWTRRQGGLKFVLFQKMKPFALSAEEVVFVLFSSNLIGMAFSRSLHYQFYVWYYHTLPFLFWNTRLPVVVRLACLAALEVCWNVYPSTPASSAGLHAVHALLIAALVDAKRAGTAAATVSVTPPSAERRRKRHWQ